jgi:hypothetical protein
MSPWARGYRTIDGKATSAANNIEFTDSKETTNGLE